MARIRTIKPEAFTSESMTAVRLAARWTFFGLITHSDDHGRHRDNPAVIAGLLWPLDPEHTALDVEEDLQQLAAEGMICRYTGCDGRSYLHITNWTRHQRVDRPSASRLPSCTSHQRDARCGICKDVCSTSPTTAPAASASPPPMVRVTEGPTGARRTLDEGSSDPAEAPQAPRDSGAAAGSPTDPADVPTSRESSISAGQGTFDESSSKCVEGSSSGSRILDPGSFLTGREAPAPHTVPAQVSAKELVREYVSSCNRRPPGNFLGHLGRETKTLLEEGFDAATLRLALERLRAKGLSPSVLPSLVNEHLNAVPSTFTGTGGYRPWTNPADDSAYDEVL
ncbi:hypothetical protein ACFY0R_09905 [Streptomyces sp. NPDC001633]|uniref:hypothetical protein n=1 Tax=Streptomyces sp. NPDC001633 TaxID=3364595 RepID=UPI0036B15726